MEHQQFMPDSEELVFNPNEYTEKELLKLVYRELHRLRGEFDDYRKNNTWQAQITEQEKKIAKLQERVNLSEILIREKEKRHQRNLAYAVAILAMIDVILKFFIK